MSEYTGQRKVHDANHDFWDVMTIIVSNGQETVRYVVLEATRDRLGRVNIDLQIDDEAEAGGARSSPCAAQA